MKRTKVLTSLLMVAAAVTGLMNTQASAQTAPMQQTQPPVIVNNQVLNPPVLMGPTGPVVGPNRGPYVGDPLMAWCNSVIQILSRAQRDAINARNRGYYAEAVSILLKGLQDANASNNYGSGPFTARALIRGLEVSTALASSMQGQPNGPMTMLHFMFEYYSFITHVTQTLDIPYYVPYLACNQCNQYNPYASAEFERRFANYTRDQLSLVLRKLAWRGQERGMPPVMPVGPADGSAFLTALSYSASYAAMDLRQSAYAAGYACIVEALENVVARIRGYNFYDVIQAVNESYFQTDMAVQALGGGSAGYACSYYAQHWSQGGWQQGYDPNASVAPAEDPTHLSTVTVPHSSFEVTSGSAPYNLKFGRARYVEQIYVQGQAIRSDATIEVIANGQVKGTIHFPAFDPTYVVTIRDTIDSIQIRHVNGARVSIQSVTSVQSPEPTAPHPYPHGQHR